ncbi:hypothetical protein FB561_6188 [Kribbella amoyensis]|uniref:Uncharacterized protein n=1 Tax=Kribbella amoyensis TaxID=996641 RepID=A0A561B7K0_9ACTN|nr:hypothetical protein [Kribbella amoyensis]TWD74757.1 hypothetical protein FB561_6188 [Kribbella amoyensis]
MPPDDGLQGVPEPEELHARLNTGHALNWGDPVPSKQEIATEFGKEPTVKSLELLRQAADHHDEVTRALLESIGPGDMTHELEHRVKSPASLARKIAKYQHLPKPPLDDVLRFTVVTSTPNALVDSVRDTVNQLEQRGWKVRAAHQSYVDGSRYKGIHAHFEARDGATVEVQFHSLESIDVKMQTTELYHVGRDQRRSKAERRAAGAEATRLSAGMTQPAGLDEMTELGGVPVDVRRYGSRVRRTEGQAPATESEEAGRARDFTRQRMIDNDGRTR